MDAKEKWETLNKEQMEAIFKKEAVLYGDNDGIPIRRALDLLDHPAILFAIKMGVSAKKLATNNYGIGERQAQYLTAWGWKIAVTYRNVEATASKYNELEELEGDLLEGSDK